MGDRIRVQFPVHGIYLGMYSHPPRSTQPGHPFVSRRMSTSHMAVTPCGWGVKADMVRLRVADETV